MGTRLWAGILFATGVLAWPAGALAVVQLARRWPPVESPGGLVLTIAVTWGLLVLVALQAGGRELVPRRRRIDEIAVERLQEPAPEATGGD